MLSNAVVGILCERGGEKLSQLQAQTGCRIQISPDRAGPEQRLCTIIGPPQGIALAKSALQGPAHPQAAQAAQAQQQQQQHAQLQQSMDAINQYRQQVAQYRAMGMEREAEMLDRQVALWTQQLQQQLMQQQMMQQPSPATAHAQQAAQQQQLQQQQIAQYYRSLAMAGGPGGAPKPEDREPLRD